MVKGQNKGRPIEKQILKIFDNAIPINLNKNYQDILKLSNHTINPNISLNCIEGNGKGLEKKPDLIIMQNNMQVLIMSIKSGKNNSVHEEGIDAFVDFLINLGAKSSEIDDLKFYFWGDGSLDGSIGEKDFKKRIKGVDITKKHPKKIKSINNTFKKYKREITERAFIGHKAYAYPTVLVYKETLDENKLWYIAMSDLINYNCTVDKPGVTVGDLTFQNQNRCLKEQDKTQGKKRSQIQFKYSKLLDRLKELTP
tara:strand:+ start:298 stop:1059 length:762 start_codon:yes stop_codon:yes gene_type:complete